MRTLGTLLFTVPVRHEKEATSPFHVSLPHDGACRLLRRLTQWTAVQHRLEVPTWADGCGWWQRVSDPKQLLPQDSISVVPHLPGEPP